jgi:hypothetical protein
VEVKMMADEGNEPVDRVVKCSDDLVAHDRKRVTAFGRYRSIVAPRKGPPAVGAPENRAVIVLEDGTEVFLEPMDSPKALRSTEERQQFEGKNVRVTGTAYKFMPSRGESLIAPCIDKVILIVEDE